LKEDPPSSDSVGYANWVANDLKLQGLIMNSLNGSMLVQIQYRETAKGMVEELFKLFGEGGDSQVVNFVRELSNMKLQPNADIDEHISKVQSLLHKLACNDVILDNRIQGGFLLGFLPESFSSFAASYRGSRQLLSDLIQELKSEHSRQTYRNSKQTHHEAGYFSKAPQGKDGGQKQRSNSETKKPIKCHFCGKSGHLKKNCWARKADQKNNKEKAPEATLLAFSAINKSCFSFIIDRGRSMHMMRDRDLFIELNLF